MQSRREVIAQLRANYDLDRRLADFCHFHQLPAGFASSMAGASSGMSKIEPMQLSVEEEDVDLLQNPQFSLPGPARLQRLFCHSLYSTLDTMPIIEFLLDVLRRAPSVQIDDKFLESLAGIAATGCNQEQIFQNLNPEESEMFRQFASKKYSLGVNEKEATASLALRYMELCLLLLLIVQNLKSVTNDENPFEDQAGANEQHENVIHDLMDDMAIEYAILGRSPSDDCITYYYTYHHHQIQSHMHDV